MSCLYLCERAQETLAHKVKEIKYYLQPSINVPGKRTSVDHLVSAQPGLIPQMSGFLTNMRITGATAFVAHFFKHVYIYLMRNITLVGTLLAKFDCEKFLNSVGVVAKTYNS